MDTFRTIVKILTALAAIAGLIYVIATYGDKIVAWGKKLLEKCPCKCCVEDCECECDCDCDCKGECTCECEEAPAEEAAPAEEVVEEVIVEEGTPVADEADFAE